MCILNQLALRIRLCICHCERHVHEINSVFVCTNRHLPFCIKFQAKTNKKDSKFEFWLNKNDGNFDNKINLPASKRSGSKINKPMKNLRLRRR